MSTTLDEIHDLSEQLRAELRVAVAEPGAAYALALEHCAAVEAMWVQEPDSDERRDAAMAAGASLDEAREAFSTAVAAAKGNRTRKMREAAADLEL